MKTRSLFMTACALATLALVPATARATWVSKNCKSDHYGVSVWKRVDSRAYADVGIGEGYEWGGGCWNDNNKDDTPQDSEGSNSGAEGPDCSGFTFKTWKLLPTFGANGGRWYNKLENIHGPYATSSYANQNAPSSWPFHVLLGANGHPTKNKDRLAYMDAYAKDGHIGMIYTVYANSANTDMIVEAVGQPYQPPVGRFERDYAANSDYVAVRREGWSPDCYPKCPTARSTEAATTVGFGTTVIVP
jgi:hypothetical protein